MPDRDALARSLWEVGNNDVQIATVLGCAPSTICVTRKRLGLPSHRTHIDHDRLRQLHSEGMTDAAIAKEMHMSVSSVSHAREYMGLRVNRARVRKQERYPYEFTKACGTKMTRALDPGQCVVMREFLHELLHCANQRRPGERYNVSKFMTEYTGRSATA